MKKKKQKNNVVFGILGRVDDDKGVGKKRWTEWRPTVDLCRHTNFPITRYELFYQLKDKKLAKFVAEDIKDISANTKVILHEIEIKNPFNLEEVFNIFYDFSKEYEFKFEKENYFVNITTGTHIMKICLFLLSEAKYFPANLVQSPKPDLKRIEKTGYYLEPFIEIDLRLEKHKKIAQRLNKEKQEDILVLKDNIKTKNPTFENLMTQILYVSKNSNSPILITGNTGVGKSSLAGRIHEIKNDKSTESGKFISVNCATLRGENVKSILFGHEKGSYTGVTGEHIGFLKKADEGTLFLDEIGDLDLEVQAMLLKAIEEKKFWTADGKKTVESNFYLIAGTNSDLNKKVRDGLFRRDLLARIDTFHFEMPDLKDRLEDFEPNLIRELEKFEEENNVQTRITSEAKKKYLYFAKLSTSIWSGNFRDLNASVIRMATFAENGVITIAVVDEEIANLNKKWNDISNKHFPLMEKVLGTEKIGKIDTFYHTQLEEVIKVCYESMNRSEAGIKLYNISRKSKKSINDVDRLSKFLKSFDLSWEIIENKLKKDFAS